jgi:hypothetical protein
MAQRRPRVRASPSPSPTHLHPPPSLCRRPLLLMLRNALHHHRALAGTVPTRPLSPTRGAVRPSPCSHDVKPSLAEQGGFHRFTAGSQLPPPSPTPSLHHGLASTHNSVRTRLTEATCCKKQGDRLLQVADIESHGPSRDSWQLQLRLPGGRQRVRHLLLGQARRRRRGGHQVVRLGHGRRCP